MYGNAWRFLVGGLEMFGCGGNIQVILYDEDKMQCFGGYLSGFEIEYQEPIFTPIEDSFSTRSIKPIGPFYAYTTLKLEHEIIRLDSTTMKRIAKHNLEKENEELLKEIEKNKREIEGLKKLYKNLQERLQTISDIGSDIWEHGAEYKKDDDDWEF